MDEAALERFWTQARSHTQVASDALAPPAWSFGGSPEEADALLDLVLDGTKTATSGALWDYEHESEPLPEQGTLSILLDGSDRPRALIEATEVAVVPFDEVGEEHARLEGEGDRSLAHWREVHERFFVDVATHGRGFVPDMPVVLEQFRVLYTA